MTGTAIATRSLPVRKPAKYIGQVAFAVSRTEDSKLTSDHRNRPVAATHVTQRSCDTSCPFLKNGCYAGLGNEGRIAWHLNDAADSQNADELTIALQEAAAIRALPGIGPLRLHIVGDCRTNEAARIVSEAADEYRDRSGRNVWTYTHAWRVVDRASWGRVSVLASCETEQDIADATARGYATELTRSHTDLPRTVAGLRTIACPQQTGMQRDCESCGLCAKDSKLNGKAIIVLNPHGAVRQVASALAGRNA